MRHVFGNRLPRVYERHKPTNDFALIHAGSSNLSQFIMIKRKTCGFRVNDNDIPVELTEIRALRIF